MLYINQNKYDHIPYITSTDPDHEAHEEGKTTTVKTSGCGLCSSLMVLDRLLTNVDFSLQDAIDLAYQCGANHAYGVDFRQYGPALCDRFSLEMKVSDDPEELKTWLQAGGAAIANAACSEHYNAVFTTGGHYIAVISVQEDGRFVILDPSFREDKFNRPEHAGKVEVLPGEIVLCSQKVLQEETQARSPRRYFLFRRA